MLTPGIRLYGLYRPVEEDTLVGGDLYDAADTPYSTRVLVGDVQGCPRPWTARPAAGAGAAAATTSPSGPCAARPEVLRPHCFRNSSRSALKRSLSPGTIAMPCEPFS